MINYPKDHCHTMVLPLVDEHRPKCYMCHEGFKNVEDLREHQEKEHKLELQEKNKEPAPGDVTVF